MDALGIVKRTILQYGLLRQGTKVVVALSGGPDSVCMLHLLHRLKQERQLELYAVHINHQLRGEAADRDQKYAEELCQSLGISCSVYTYDILSIAKKRCVSTEDAGRQMRYQAFFEEKEKRGAHVIAVAHNQNDQAETVLMRLMRGTGVAGLGGMEYDREDGVIRPILDLSRSQIEQYCEAYKLNPCIDQTNLESLYTRNRIRLELIPYMEQHFNENVIGACCRLAAIAREETSLIDDILSHEMDKCRKDTEEGGICLSLPALRDMHPALRHRCLQKVLAQLGLTQNLSFVHLEQADKVILAERSAPDLRTGHSGDQPSKTVEFPKDFRMERKGEELRFFQIKQTEEKKCASNGVLKEKLLKNDRQTDWKSMPPFRRCFDYDSIKSTGISPILRKRQPGDFIQPLGMSGTKKLQDYFTDRKVPKEKRDQIPVVCLGQEVLWVVGGQTNEKFKVTEASENILSLEFDGEIW